MKKQTFYVILIFLYFGCSQENILPDNPISDDKPLGAVEIETENLITITFALTKTPGNGYAITGLAWEDETNFYPFFASIG